MSRNFALVLVSLLCGSAALAQEPGNPVETLDVTMRLMPPGATLPDAVTKVIELPAAQITCPTFGGPDLEVLYVSSAAIGMSAADFAKAPDAGGLFALEVGVRGQAVNRLAA